MTHLNFTLATPTFSYGKRNIISVKRKIQYSSYFPKLVQPPTTPPLAPTSFNSNILNEILDFAPKY